MDEPTEFAISSGLPKSPLPTDSPDTETHPSGRMILTIVVVGLALVLGFVLSVIIGVFTGIIPFNIC
jgi:hypothetical protein